MSAVLPRLTKQAPWCCAMLKAIACDDTYKLPESRCNDRVMLADIHSSECSEVLLQSDYLQAHCSPPLTVTISQERHETCSLPIPPLRHKPVRPCHSQVCCH